MSKTCLTDDEALEHGTLTVVDGSEGIVVLGADGRSSAVAKRGNASADAASSTRSGLDTDLVPRTTHTVSAWESHDAR